MKTRYYFNEHDQFRIVDSEKIIQYAKKKKVRAGDIEVIPDSDNISHQQRKYFFGLVAESVHERFVDLGNDVGKQDVVDFLKDQFLHYEKLCPITGKYIKVYYSLSNSSKGLSKEVFQEKKMLIQQWCIEKLKIDIPDPDPNWRVYK